MPTSAGGEGDVGKFRQQGLAARRTKGLHPTRNPSALVPVEGKRRCKEQEQQDSEQAIAPSKTDERNKRQYGNEQRPPKAKNTSETTVLPSRGLGMGQCQIGSRRRTPPTGETSSPGTFAGDAIFFHSRGDHFLTASEATAGGDRVGEEEPGSAGGAGRAVGCDSLPLVVGNLHDSRDDKAEQEPCETDHSPNIAEAYTEQGQKHQQEETAHAQYHGNRGPFVADWPAKLPPIQQRMGTPLCAGRSRCARHLDLGSTTRTSRRGE